MDVDSWAFGFTSEPDAAEGQQQSLPWDRARGMRAADGPLAACHSSFAYRMRVPGGGTVPTAGLTWVGVHPAHRRRGLLTAMIADHFERSLARGEIVSTLYAAETKIYQRFGYGLGCPAYNLTLGRAAELRPVEGSDDLRVVLETADIAAHGPVVREVLARTQRPGHHATVPDPQIENIFRDPVSWREGRERKRFVAVHDARGAAAFATFARKGDWNDTGPAGVVHVDQWAAVDAAATRRLFSVLCDLDLMATTLVKNIAPDDPLLHLLGDVRAVNVRMSDNLWVRVLDFPAAVAARAYGADANVLLHITDPHLPQNEGVWRVRIVDGAGTATLVDDQSVEPQITTAMQEVSAAYLGGVTFGELANAGLIDGDPAAVASLSAAWVGTMRPVSALNF